MADVPCLAMAPHVPDGGGNMTWRFAWPVPGQPWVATGLLAIRGQQIEITELHVQPLEGADGVTAELLRDIRVGEIIADAQAQLRQGAEITRVLAAAFPEQSDARASAARILGVKETRQGRPPVPDTVLAAVANAYLAEAERPGRLGPLAARLRQRLPADPAVKSYLRGGGLTAARVRHWISRAEQAGYLGVGRKGTSRRLPGPRLIAMQEGDQED